MQDGKKAPQIRGGPSVSGDTLEPLDRGGCQKEDFFSGRAQWVVDALQGCDVFDGICDRIMLALALEGRGANKPSQN